MQPHNSLIEELEVAIQSGSRERRVETLRRVTDLFLSDAHRLNDEQICMFDDVLKHLVERVEQRAVAELSERLAPVDNAPIEVVRRLAYDDEIIVAGPVLSQSTRLTSEDLIDVARCKSQGHLLAISNRARIETLVTDVLLERGDRVVMSTLAGNNGARFSEAGFATLVKRSEEDATLAEKVGLRLDLPLQLFRQLLLRATEAVRSRLLAMADPQQHSEIQRILADISVEIERESAPDYDFVAALRRVQSMQASGSLNEQVVANFANGEQYPELVAAISLLCSAQMDLIDRLLSDGRNEALLIPCKVAGLKWATVSAILKNRLPGRQMPEHDIQAIKADFFRLTQRSAQRVLHFWQVRQTASADQRLSEATGRTMPKIANAAARSSPYPSSPQR